MGRFGYIRKNYFESTESLGAIIPTANKVDIDSLDIQFKQNIMFIDEATNNIQFTNSQGDVVSANNSKNVTYVYSSEDFGKDIVDFRIQLKANHCYIICGDVMLDGVGLETTGTTAILGLTSEISFLRGDGDSVLGALIKSTHTLTFQNISLSCTFQLFDINTAGLGAFDWLAVNIINTISIGTIKNCANFIAISCTFIDSAGLIFDGTFGSISFDTTLFNSATTFPLITLASTLIITRRIRFVFSAFVILTNEIGISFISGATIPNDQFIVFSCNFSGGSANYIQGVTSVSNISDWKENKGITNSSSVGGLFMINNTIATVLSNNANWFKILGTTTIYGITKRFTHTNNRLTYIGVVTSDFKISVVLSASSASNTQLLIFRIYKNGVALPESESQTTTSNAGRSENVKMQAAVSLALNDYIEVFVRNESGNTNATITELNVIVEKLL